MASIYDCIGTARELIEAVQLNGLSTKEEDICRVQDIFGNSTLEDLDSLANDIGRADANGNPDPEGAWSSPRRGTRDTFYFVLFRVWHWEDAVRFFNAHSNPDTRRLSDAVKKLRAGDQQKKALEARIEGLKAESRDFRDSFVEEHKKTAALADQLDAAREEIIRLKARLFDVLEGGR